jgi:low temperature requirement protein LtrA
LVQIAGALILAAGVPAAFDGYKFSVVTLGYAIMRLAIVAQWLRAARTDVGGRRTAIRYALGVSACQLGWIARLALPDDWGLVSWCFLVAAELAVPIWAERAAPTSWHREHIAERYGLFTLIVLGESVLAASTAIQTALAAGERLGPLLVAAGSGLLIVFMLWWLYDTPSEAELTSVRSLFVWGYGHLLIFASAAAVGAGLQATIDTATGEAHLSPWVSGLTVSVPVAVYLISVWFLRPDTLQATPAQRIAAPLVAVLILAAAATPFALPVVALLLVGKGMDSSLALRMTATNLEMSC